MKHFCSDMDMETDPYIVKNDVEIYMVDIP